MAAHKSPFQGTLFEENFLVRTLGTIAYSPDVALTELVANAWDAGASQVDLTIPDSPGMELVIADNGCGMTAKQFNERRSALVHAVALAHRGVTYSRSWAADSPLVRVRLASRLEQAHNEIALLREEIRIKDARWAKIDARRRPRYLPAYIILDYVKAGTREGQGRDPCETGLFFPETGHWVQGA